MTSVWRPIEAEKDGNSDNLFDAPPGSYVPNTLQKILIAVTQNTVLQRGALRANMVKLIMSFGGPLDIGFRGCTYRIEGRNNLIETGLLTRPSYNAEEIEFLQQDIEGGTAVDIGCNVGLYSLPLAKAAGASGRVLAIDANPEMIERLKFNAQASSLDNIQAVNMAAGGHEALVDLQIRQDDVAIVSVKENAAGSTPMLPLLRIITDAGLDRIDSLKIDIEGHEDLAMVPFLQSASDNLLPNRIVIERAGPDGDYPGCVKEFERLGYRLIGRTRNNSMYQRG